MMTGDVLLLQWPLMTLFSNILHGLTKNSFTIVTRSFSRSTHFSQVDLITVMHLL